MLDRPPSNRLPRESQQQRRRVSVVMTNFDSPCLILEHQRSSPGHFPNPSSAASSQPSSPPTYHLFNLVPSEGLVHQRSSTRDDLDPTIPKPRLPPSDPARKYVCSECGSRFSKPSTLRVSWSTSFLQYGTCFTNLGFIAWENHYLTHTGERRT